MPEGKGYPAKNVGQMEGMKTWSRPSGEVPKKLPPNTVGTAFAKRRNAGKLPGAGAAGKADPKKPSSTAPHASPA